MLLLMFSIFSDTACAFFQYVLQNNQIPSIQPQQVEQFSTQLIFDADKSFGNQQQGKLAAPYALYR